MSCENKASGKEAEESPPLSTFEKLKAHAKEFIEASPEEHKQ